MWPSGQPAPPIINKRDYRRPGRKRKLTRLRRYIRCELCCQVRPANSWSIISRSLRYRRIASAGLRFKIARPSVSQWSRW